MSYPNAVERFARACPFHHEVLDELEGGRLCCPRGHIVDAWLVFDVGKGRVLGAGRLTKNVKGRTGVCLGPGLRLSPDVLLNREPRRYALPLPGHPAAA